MDKIKKLIKILNDANYNYYEKNSPTLTDSEFDQLYDQLLDLESQTGIIYDDSPTKNVGFVASKSLKKFTHPKKMLSLDKTKNVSKLKEFLNDKTGLISWKLDGLTIVLFYENGILNKIVTRGNGEIGEDVTHNIVFFKNIPRTIPYKDTLIIRGEAVLSYTDFEEINSKIDDDKKYKNSRNLCSGIIRQINHKNIFENKINFFAFCIVNDIEKDFANSKLNKLIFVKELGIDIVEHLIVNIENIENYIEIFKNKISKFDFATDGLVLTYDEINYSDSLGFTSKFPKDSIAFKWKDETKESKLIDIKWNTSRTGLINPIAVFEPVELEGTTVTKASIHNVTILEDLELGIGDILLVYKANMIIPQILENKTRSNTYTLPKFCPNCNFEVTINSKNKVKTLCCTNPNCQSQLINSLTHFTSRNAMNIEGLSESTLKKLVDNNFINNYTNIFFLEQFKSDLLKIEGINEKSLQNLFSNIEKSKSVYLENFIYSLGIKGIGLSNAKLLCQYFEYDINKIISSKLEDLVIIKNFGEEISSSIVFYFSNKQNLKNLEIILPILIFKNTKDTNNLLQNMSFAITGNIELFDNRSSLVEIITQNGGKVSSNVSKNTSYLICNDLSSNNSKNQKAIELNIQRLTEIEFINKFKITPKTL